MRILIFNWRDIRNPDAGGAEIFTHENVRMGHQRHKLLLFSPLDFLIATHEKIEDIDIRLYKISLLWLAGIFTSLIGAVPFTMVMLPLIKTLSGLGINLKGVDATDMFLERLAGLEDPEKK